MEFVRRAFLEFFKQLSYRKCTGCNLLYDKKSMSKPKDEWLCSACSNPAYKAFIDSVGI